jgi:signal transduction histidine kinase
MSQAEDWEGSAKPAEEALQRLAAAIPQGVAMLRSGRVVWANLRLLELVGCETLAQLAEMELADWLVDSGHGLPDALRGRAVECTLRRADGDERTVVCRLAWPEIAPATDAWVFEDTTHVRSLERELLRANRELHARNREVTSLRDQLRNEQAEREELLTVVSHELRTPVTVISGYNRLLLSEQVGPLGEEQRRFLEESTKSCRKLDRFIGNLMVASREPKGGDILEVCSGSLLPVIEGVAASMRPLLEEREMRIEVRADEEGCRARFDRAAVEQILTNLVGNAIRYAPTGGNIEISARKLPTPERLLVEVSVSDDGPGVAAEDRLRIFEPYAQAGDESRAGHLGLGLAICKRLVEGHGGTIGVSKRPGGGSCFAFTLPGAEA